MTILEMERRENDKLKDYKENWELLSTARSIFILGGVRCGKTALTYGLCKKLESYKKVYWFNFPNEALLKKEGWYSLKNLDELSRTTDAVVVMDEIALTLKKYEKKNNDELQKILTLAGQNNLTIIIISQISQIVNKALEGLIDCHIVLDYDYVNLKNGSRAKNMIKDYATFAPEHFRLEKGTFLYYSRNFPIFEKIANFKKHPTYTDEWSLAYKNNAAQSNKEIVKNKVNTIQW